MEARRLLLDNTEDKRQGVGWFSFIGTIPCALKGVKLSKKKRKIDRKEGQKERIKKERKKDRKKERKTERKKKRKKEKRAFANKKQTR